jgi:PAS domain S-box-containing protein
VLDSSEQIHLVLDALGRVELFNQAAVRICLALGGEPPRRGRTVTHFLPARLAQGLELGLAAALGGRPHQHDVDLPDREGRRRRFIVRYAPLSALPDTAPQVCFNAYDITARAEAEDELRLRNHALGSISQGVVITGPDRRVTYVNDGFTEITGYSAEEVLGRSCGFLQGPDTDADFDVRLRRCLAVGAPFEGEVFNHRKDGSTFWNELTITPVRNERGDITQWVGVQRDITERKRQQDALAVSQARLQALFDHSHDAILLADDEGRFLEANPAACALLGRPRDELVGRHHALMHVAEEPLLVAAAWQDFLRTGRQAGECILRRADGSTVRAEYHAVAGIQPGVHLTIIRDVTERHALQAKVLRQQRLESVGRLASGVAHNLNNVFTPILMAPTILRAHLTDPGARMLVESIEAGARRGSTIVRHLLTFARGESGDKMPLDLRDILREVAAFIRDTFPKEIAMELSLPPSSLPFPVIGDAHQLQQAVINLALNSADAMEARGGRLVLALERADLGLEEAGHEPGAHPGPHAVISVADHGVGIAAEHLDKIFDPFFTTKPLAQGSGLGLSVVLGIVRGHGGFARVTSRPGVGTVMRLYFPLQFAPDTAPAGPAPVVVAPGRAAPVVLVVDDEAPVRDILRSILARVGCNVLCADGADAAFAQLQACGGRVDLVITDLMMPGVSGAKFIELLHGRRRDLPILVISGADAENHLDPSIRARVRGVVSKPCDVQALVAAVRRVLAEERPAESPLGVLAIPAAAAAIV